MAFWDHFRNVAKKLVSKNGNLDGKISSNWFTPYLKSLLGVFIVKCTNGQNRKFIGDVFLGLAVSTMLGDSFLHIMPSVLGLHDHSHEEDEHDHDHDHDHDEHDHDDTEYYLVLGKMGLVLGSMYAFWIFESG